MGLLEWIIVGFLAGAGAQRLTGGRRYGCAVTVALGVAGAVLGGIIAGRLGVTTEHHLVATLVMSLVGALVLLALVNLARPRVP